MALGPTPTRTRCWARVALRELGGPKCRWPAASLPARSRPLPLAPARFRRPRGQAAHAGGGARAAGWAWGPAGEEGGGADGPRAVIGGRQKAAEALEAWHAAQAELRQPGREDAAVPGAPQLLHALPAARRGAAGLSAHLPAGLGAVAAAVCAAARSPVPERGRPALLRLPEHGALLLRELHRGADNNIWRFAKT